MTIKNIVAKFQCYFFIIAKIKLTAIITFGLNGTLDLIVGLYFGIFVIIIRLVVELRFMSLYGSSAINDSNYKKKISKNDSRMYCKQELFIYIS